jgi:ADP-ribose pyrophosphatase YjhB (NUDIX family)
VPDIPRPGIRLIVIGIFRRGSRILVAPGYDDVKRERFLRPLGGAIEFGEAAEDALRREIREELGLEICDPVRLGVLENRFEFRGRPGHEIVFVFDAAFVDPDVYARSTVPILEAGWDGPAGWIDLAAPLPWPLYPTGLERLLSGAG